MATPTADGDFEIAEMVVFAAPTGVLTLAPPDIADTGPEFAASKPRASTVQVIAGDQTVAVPDDARVTAPTAVPLAVAVTQVELRYTLSGVMKRSVPAPPGRALAAIGPLTAGVLPDFPVQIMVSGDEVSNLFCPHLRLSEQACARGSLPRLRVDQALPWRTAHVLVQLDLPRPQ